MVVPHESIRTAILPAIDTFPVRLLAIYLYGSRATGDITSDSDYDFAAIAERPLTSGETSALRQSFVDALPDWPEVDCVDMRRIPLTLAVQVLEYGIVLECRDESERVKVEARLFSMYAFLNEERAEIVDDIVERGSVYA
jgi:uncharacterized protein